MLDTQEEHHQERPNTSKTYQKKRAKYSPGTSEESFEDLLSYDDIFWDYFNYFLMAPVFPIGLCYNRLTGAFENNQLNVNEDGSTKSPIIQYGATSEECEKMLMWAQQKRLPHFIRSELFREMKLCKLIIRPLDEQQGGSNREFSQLIRGYSRQTESCVSSLSNGASTFIESQDPSWIHFTYSAPLPQKTFSSKTSTIGNVVDDGYLTSCSEKDNTWMMTMSKTPKSADDSCKQRISCTSPYLLNQSENNKDDALPRNNSSCIPPSSLLPFTSKSETKIREVTFSRENTILSYKQDSPENNEVIRNSRVDICPTSYVNDVTDHFFRISSAPVCHRDLLSMNWYGRFDDVLSSSSKPLIDFDSSTDKNTVTDSDIQSLEGHLQETKKIILGSYRGMKGFKEFLSDTTGIYLLNFWLDCEEFKDKMKDYIESVNVQKKTQLFRDIQDKYKMNLTKEAKEQIQKCSNNVSISDAIFVQTQYDVLRRLRTYWIPRYLLHLEWNNKLLNGSSLSNTKEEFLTKKGQYGTFTFTTIDLEPFPKHPEYIINATSGQPAASFSLNQSSKLRGCCDVYLIALTSDRRFGGPFQLYLKLKNDEESLKGLNFWQDVTEYSTKINDCVDRQLCMEHAWDIYHKFITNVEGKGFELSKKEKDIIFNTLQSTEDYISADIFYPIKEYVLQKLEPVWIQYLQDDLQTYFKCYVGSQTPSTDGNIHISLQQGKLILRLPGFYNEVSEPQIDRNNDATNENKLRNKNLILEELKMKEKAWNKAKQSSLYGTYEQKNINSQSLKTIGDNTDFDDNSSESLPSPFFKDYLFNKSIMTAFKKYVKNVQDGYQMVSIIELYVDIEYLKNQINSGTTKQTMINRKYDLVNNIKGICLSDNKLIDIDDIFENGEVELMVDNDINKLDIDIIDKIQENISKSVEDAFNSFLMSRCDECGISDIELTKMTRADIISLLTKKDRETYPVQIPKKSTIQRKKRKSITAVVPKKEEEEELFSVLQQCSVGQMSVQLVYFHIFLTKTVDEELLPFVDKDLLFYIDVLRLKAAYKRSSQERILKKKVQYILEFYLESKSQPTVCIDIPNDVYLRTVKATHQFLCQKQRSCHVFDEAQSHIFKELITFWVHFRRSPDTTDITEGNKNQESISYESPVKIGSSIGKEISIPSIPNGTTRVLSYSLAEGVKWRPISTLHSFTSSEMLRKRSVNLWN